jgi:hypothetical protein
MHEIMNKKFYLGPKFGTLFNSKWITISELLHKVIYSWLMLELLIVLSCIGYFLI